LNFNDLVCPLIEGRDLDAVRNLLELRRSGDTDGFFEFTFFRKVSSMMKMPAFVRLPEISRFYFCGPQCDHRKLVLRTISIFFLFPMLSQEFESCVR